MSIQNEIINTKDSGVTLYQPVLDETYHSRHGAIPESEYVYIENGLALCNKTNIKVLEIGWGTGLNGALSLSFAKDKRLNIEYLTLEKYPLSIELNAEFIERSMIQKLIKNYWDEMMRASWEEWVEIEEGFKLKKTQTDVLNFEPEPNSFDIVYFDAFAPSKQPDIWDISVLQKCYDALVGGGWLTTYCAQGQFKRNLKSIGFTVYERPGPVGKKEITVAQKP